MHVTEEQPLVDQGIDSQPVIEQFEPLNSSPFASELEHLSKLSLHVLEA